jgi:hypothetical protein
MNPRALFSLAISLALSGSLSAATFTVVSTNAAGAGSLQQAILDANASAGADAITFNLASGLTISLTNALPGITEPVTIDGSTQPGFVGIPLVELNGAGAGAATDGLKLNTSNSVIRALIINRFLGDGIEITNGANNTIAGCYLGLNRTGLTDQGNTLNGILLTNSPNNIIGGLHATNRNYIAGNNQSGVHFGGGVTTNNVLFGNFIGLNTNNAAIVNSVDGVRVNAPANIIGGGASGSRNVISGNTGQGIEITALGSGTIVRGNYIGTDGTGTLDRGNSTDGIWVGAGGVIIGGSNPGEGNLISGNNGEGIELSGISATNNLVLGNIIGANLGGAGGLLNSGHGILITTSSRSNVIGGVLAGQGNLIAFNGADGISVVAAVANTNNAFRGNTIFSNADLGIDLAASGVTANDAGDADTGANQSQNFPILTTATNFGGSVTITGNLNSTPNTQFALDFFATTLFDPSGAGEGEFYLGATSVTTDGGGNASFSVTLPVGLTGRYVSATATDPYGNTSEFSPVVTAFSTLPPQTFTVINTNDSGPGSLRQAILNANAAVTTGADQIHFAIPGAGPHLIAPVTALPPLADPVVIDGYTQSGASPNTLAVGNDAVPKIRLDGNSVSGDGPGLVLWGGTSTVRGLSITRFNGTTGFGIEVVSGNNTIQGNFIGLSPDGITGLGNDADGIRITSGNNLIGGLAPAARNVVSGNLNDGIEINGSSASGNVVRGNYIGTDASGTLSRGNNTDGIFITTAPGNSVINNLLSGNNSEGITLSGSTTTNTVIHGNLIGTDAAGVAPLRNEAHGIQITSAANNTTVGGANPGEGNVIAYNGAANTWDGVFVASGGGNAIRRNRIFTNNGMGIDLGATGVQANDAGDADTGANLLQNFPILTAATNTGASVTIAGSLNAAANTQIALDFFATGLFDPTGHGEGDIYLGSTNVTTDVGGNVSFLLTFPAGLNERYFSATATDPNGNTSEFGPVVAAQSTVATVTFTVINTNDSGPGSLRQAILDANASITAGADRIHFAIPGPGPHLIAPVTALPPVADPVIIDGYTQSGASSNSSPGGNNAVLQIRLDGNSAPINMPGLSLWGGNSTVCGLAITRFKSASGNGLELFSNNNLVTGNFIGLGADAVTAQGNGGDGIRVTGGNNLIGGSTPAARNLIAANTGDGIEFNGPAAGNNVVRGNIIGSANGAPGLQNGGNGVLMTGSSSGNVIGGLLAGQPNVIAFNGAAGLSVAAAVANTNNTFRGNAIFANGALGIDLGANGVTVNDAADADGGANQLQNFPFLTAVTTNSPTAVTVSGSFASAANASYAVDFYANTALDGSGHGEGQFYLGSTNLTTDGAGQVEFELTIPTALPGRYVAATATDANGNTSEFSRWKIAVSSIPSTNVTVGAADFVFIIDASSSMGGEIAAVKNGLGNFVTGLNTAQVDARFAIVLYGGPTELIQDFTSDQLVTEGAFDLISVNGAFPGIHNNHNLNPEAGLEAIRIVLDSATNSTLQRTHVGGSGPLAFRPNARKNLVLVTDENSDLPYYAENRQVGQTGTEPPSPLTAPWQAEVDVTAQVLIGNNAFVNMLISPAANPSRNQYGDPTQSVSDANFLNYDPDATLANLITAGYGNSLQAQVLAAGLVGRTFNITAVDTANFVANFFAAKVEEIINNPPPRPRLNIASLPNAVRLTWTTNSAGYVLETNRALTLVNGWGVLTTNYSVIGTNYAVTNQLDDALRFYRLRR